MINDEYDEITDRQSGGFLSLDLGASAYGAAMGERDPGARNQLFQRAAHWYERSASYGNAQAATNLGYVYLYGRLGAVDDDQAFAWFSRGAELGNEESCYKLGDLYRSGRGCERDYDKAFSLYRQAERIAKLTCKENVPGDQAVLASIDLRLAGQYEHSRTNGDRDKAHEYYARAVQRFRSAVAAGLHWYAKTLRGAEEGAERTAPIPSDTELRSDAEFDTFGRTTSDGDE
ncbi:tetratricopeptide repeat protein [Bifidobacterium simiarum]|uniref:tetratricopeptide repeat protein n=1 Tax=Bifidobacterium simiarum TaxID=2045441 RepID=UPI001BDBD10D|nr:tetratricopeptide repeat protein [Bifidobacterium simiarum]MBT1166280.1 sel1 repeat family protein [Bifidobacterium simiarum]